MRDLRNRTISQSDLDKLKEHHEGMYRLVKAWNWTVATVDETPTITLADLGLEHLDQPEPAEPAELVMPGELEPLRVPTLEEYLAAGYPAENYAAFVKHHAVLVRDDDPMVDDFARSAMED